MKVFWSVFIGILIVIFSVIFFGWSYVPSYISSALSAKAKVPVSISYISVTPNSINISDLRIRNPKGSILPMALKAKKTVSRAPIMTYFKDHVLIDEIALNGCYLGLEFESALNSNGNWSTIINNLRSSMQTDSKAAKGNKTVLIKKLIVRNLNIDLVFRQNNQGVRRLNPVSYMEFNNISSEGGFPTSQIMNLIMSEILREVFSKENLMNMLRDTIKSPGRSGTDVFDSLKSLFSSQENTSTRAPFKL